MLEFVNVSGSSGGKDDQTRRKVRSQAMRDFRRRQREEREAADKPGRKHLTAPFDRRSVSPAGRDRAVSTGSESAPVSRRASARVVKHRSPPIWSQQAGEYSFAASVAVAPPEISDELTTLEGIDTLGQWHLDDLLQVPYSETPQPNWQAQLNLSFPSDSLHQQQNAWNSHTDDYFESPEQIQQMLGFCRSYIHWLQPGIIAESASMVVGRIWEQAKSPMLLAACCLVAVGHLDAVQPDRPAGNYEFYKAKILRDIGQSVLSSETATSDTTIAALTCLMSYEMSQGSIEAFTHLQGLQGTLSLKGGIEQIELDGLIMSIEVLDALHAVLFEHEPLFARAITTQSTDQLAHGRTSDANHLCDLTSKILADGGMHRLDVQDERFIALGKIPQLLTKACACLARQVAENVPVDTEASQEFLSALQNFGASSCRGDPTSDTVHLGRCCYFTMSISHNLISNEVPHRHGSNQASVHQLYDAVRRVKNGTWADLTYLRLFILLTGAVSTTDPSQKSFFKAELVRTIYQPGQCEWQQVKDFITSFIQMKSTLERPARRSALPVGMMTLKPAQRTYSAPQLSLVIASD